MGTFISFFKRVIPRRLLSFFLPAYHFSLSALAAFYYGFPSRHLTVIGVTGTNGKTTVVHLIHEIFTAAGFKVGSISSLRFNIDGHEEQNLLKLTMPGRFRLQKFLAGCRKAGCRWAVLEVTSEGIKQFRHRFIRFRAAVLTNITPEHIEAHGSFEAYRTAKLELFKRLPSYGFAVLNHKDESAELFAESSRAEVVWYSRDMIETGGVGRPVKVARVEPQLIYFEIENVFMETRLGGEFNVLNILAAAATALVFDVSPAAISKALAAMAVIPGRLEFIQQKPFAVVVDYAHTPDALEKLYLALGRDLVCVFGSAGGGRDKWKRPKMGKIAGLFCKQIILTSEDPDDEDPSRIVSEIQSGIPKDKIQMATVVIDRHEAIRAALRGAKPGDKVIITGMGAQPWFIEKGKKIPWDERAIVGQELEAIKSS